jgi:hypothetical protein
MRGTLLFWILFGWFAAFQEEGPPSAAAEIMGEKLDLSHDILDALVLDDFEALEAYSSDLAALSRAGELDISDTESYINESRAFRRAARELGVAARARNSEAAALAYVDLTLRCLRCHQLFGSLPRR